MSDPVTDNYSLVLPTVGGDSGTWGGVQNNGIFSPVDAILGANLPVTINASDVNLSTSQFQNAIFVLSGTLTGNRSLIVPLSPNSATLACGGRFVVVNNTTGNFNVTVKTAASGSVGVTVPQGFTAFLYSDKTNVGYCSGGLPGFAAAVNGNPNGQLAGTAGSATTNAQLAYDYANSILYVCTTTGNAAGAVWTNSVSGSLAQPQPEGYLTPTSNTPIITTDVAAAAVIFYTPFVGAWTAIHNGSQIIPYRFTQLQLTLSASQAANNIYDVYLAYNSGVPVIGTGPSWVAGSGGSITPGSCARGTGAGGAAISRDASAGLWVNTASMSLIYNTGAGNNTITVAAGQGIYLGSLWIDAAAGQVTCNRTWGSGRKFGIYNAYNQTEIVLQAGLNTGTWNYDGGIRESNGTTTTFAASFSGLPQGFVKASFLQNVTVSAGSGSDSPAATVGIGIGLNSTSAFSGTPCVHSLAFPSSFNGFTISFANLEANLVLGPTLGINNLNCLEQSNITGSRVLPVFNGGQSNMALTVSYPG